MPGMHEVKDPGGKADAPPFGTPLRPQRSELLPCHHFALRIHPSVLPHPAAPVTADDRAGFAADRGAAGASSGKRNTRDAG